MRSDVDLLLRTPGTFLLQHLRFLLLYFCVDLRTLGGLIAVVSRLKRWVRMQSQDSS